MELQLDGRTALVTGSNRGTGSVIAGTLAAEGAHVFVHGPGASDGQPELCAAIAEQGGRATAVHGGLHMTRARSGCATGCSPRPRASTSW